MDIGVGVGISGNRTGSFSWSSYWATLISATVENAAPTNVILTFEDAKTTLGANDFTVTINGVASTVNSASWAGAVLTLVIADTVVYGDVVVVTFVRTGGTANVTNNINPTSELTTYITGLATPLSVGHRKDLNEFIKRIIDGLSIANLSDAFDFMYIISGETKESSYKNIVKNLHHITEAGTITWSQFEGVTSDGSSGYLDTNYNPSTQGVNFLQNNCSIGIYSRTNATSTGTSIGHEIGVNATKIVYKYTNNNGYFALNMDRTKSRSAAMGTTLGMLTLTRNGSATGNLYTYKDETLLTTSTGGVVSTGAPSNSNIFICAVNDDGVAAEFTTRQYSFAFGGKYLTQQMVATICNAFRTYMKSKGKNVAPDCLVGFGDSVTAGTGATAAANRYINIIAATNGYSLVNAGIGSTPLQNTVQNAVSTIGAAADNNGRDTYATRISAYYPDYVIILYGLNDIFINDANYTANLFENDLGEIVDALVTSGIDAQKIIIGSPSYCNGYAFASPYDGGSLVDHQVHTAKCLAVASAKGTKYIDIYQWMVDNGGNTLMSVDNVHPNDAGHAQIAAAFLSVI